MRHDPQNHQRRSVRLEGYDYTQPGAYFVTLVTWQREELFGMIRNGEMHLTLAGQCVEAIWQTLPNNFGIRIDEWVIMPNHLHGIVVIEDHDHTGEASGSHSDCEQAHVTPDASPLPPDDGIQRPKGTTRGSLAAMV